MNLVLIAILIAVAVIAMAIAALFVLIVISIQTVDRSKQLLSEPRSFRDATTRRLLGNSPRSSLRRPKEG